MKKGAERRTGNHKGCPYDRFAGAYFHTNDRETRPIIAGIPFYLPLSAQDGRGDSPLQAARHETGSSPE